jgi:hypothetical protein
MECFLFIIGNLVFLSVLIVIGYLIYKVISF